MALNIQAICQQLRERRVIRAAIIYGALLWALLQAADVAAGAGLISDTTVRWLIIAGAVGLPVTLVVSWFVEGPWHARRWTAVAGDLAIMVAISVAVGLFAWQQWFVHPLSVQVGRFVASDARPDTQSLADHLAARLALALGATEGIAIVPDEADWQVTATLSQHDGLLRLGVQLHGSDGTLAWGERFEDRLIDIAALELRVINAIWSGLSARGSADVRALLSACEYPADPAAILAVADWPNVSPDAMDALIAAASDDGWLRIARARQLFASLETARPPERPVIHRMALQQLAFAEERCAGYTPIDVLRRRFTQDFHPAGS